MVILLFEWMPRFGFARSLDVAVQVNATIETMEKLTGTAVYTVTNTGTKPVQDLRFLLYPNQFRSYPSTLAEYTAHWIYPSGFQPGGMTIDSATISVDASNESSSKRRVVAETFFDTNPPIEKYIYRLSLTNPLQPGATVRVNMRFTVTIPKRRGRFGYYDGVLSLAGGWMPRLLPANRTVGTGPIPITLSGEVSIPPSFGAFVINRFFTATENRQKRAIDRATVDEATLVLMDKMNVVARKLSFGTAYLISNQYLGITKKNPTSSRRQNKRTGRSAGVKSNRADRVERIFNIATDTHMLFSSYDLPSKDLFIIEVPTWDRLVQVSENAVLLSDRTFELVPAPKAQLFHDADVAKNVATLFSRNLVKKEGHLTPFISEVVGVHFQRRYLKEVSSPKEELAHLLRIFAFNPYIDNLIYAPQIPFGHVYARSIEEKDVFRDELWRCVNTLPRGKRIVAKLEDLLGKSATNQLFDEYLQSHKTFSEVLDDQLANGEQFRAQWYGVYPRVSYAIGNPHSRKKNDVYEHSVLVRQQGASVVEPVTVRLQDEADNTIRLKWDGNGMETTLFWQSPAPLKSVQLDPDFRLVETGTHQGHPLGDNAVPQKMRPPLLTQLLVWGDSVTREPFVVASFGFRRKYDISNSFHLQGAATPRLVGGDFSYLRHFGPNRTLNSRTWYAGPQLGLYKYQDAAAVETTIPAENRYTATMGTITMLAGTDDRRYLMDPSHGKAFQIGLGYAAGQSENRMWVQHAKGSLRLFKNVPLALHHSLAFYMGSSAVVGTPPASNLVSLSHRQILRGFDLGETYGKLSLYGVTEYRHTLIGATKISFPLKTLLSRIQGVLFSGIGTASLPQDYHSIFTPERLFAEVGYGLRFHMLLLGVVPYLIAIDFAVPVFPRTRQYMQLDSNGLEQTYNRSPFRFVFGITQTY